jgi:mRNA-degrading endonuclease HigB of HigAB toxin-antitoxin module
VRSNFTNNSKNIIFLTLNRLKDGSKNFDLYNYNISTKKIEKIHTFNLTKTEGGYPDYYIFKSTPYIMFKKSKSANNLNLTDKNFIIQNIETKEYKDFNIPINENINLASSMSIDSLDNYNLKNNLYGYDTKIIQDKWLKFDVKTRLVNKIFYAVDLLTLKTIVSYNYQGKGIKEALYIDKIEVDDSFLSKE